MESTCLVECLLQKTANSIVIHSTKLDIQTYLLLSLIPERILTNVCPCISWCTEMVIVLNGTKKVVVREF